MHALRNIAMIVLLVPAVCLAQKRIPVEVAHSGDGATASAVVLKLRNAIQASRGAIGLPDTHAPSAEAYGMRVTTELSRPRIKLQLVSADGEAPSSGSTPIAVTVVYDSASMPLGGALIKSMLVTCGADSSACARQILVKANSSIEWLRQHWPSIWNTL